MSNTNTLSLSGLNLFADGCKVIYGRGSGFAGMIFADCPTVEHAANIVAACNAHDALVEALVDIERIYSDSSHDDMHAVASDMIAVARVALGKVQS